MQNSQEKFHGQQDGERVLYSSGQHPVAMVPGGIKAFGLGLAIVLLFVIFNGGSGVLPGILFGIILFSLGFWMISLMQKRNRFYITNRRIVRFDATTPFTTNLRSLSWTDTVKVKAYPSNLFWKMLNVGNIVVHAQSTYVHVHEPSRETILANDDTDLKYVYYYQDLANYIDKIIYLYKTNPQEIASLRPFIPKPKGQRY